MRPIRVLYALMLKLALAAPAFAQVDEGFNARELQPADRSVRIHHDERRTPPARGPPVLRRLRR
jgi:hypothetical protein